MNLTPTHIPPWLERLGVPLGLGGLVLGLGWYFFVAGVGTGIELRREQLEALTREIGQGAGLEQQLQDRASRNRRLASRLESLKAALPRGERTARLLRRGAGDGHRLPIEGKGDPEDARRGGRGFLPAASQPGGGRRLPRPGELLREAGPTGRYREPGGPAGSRPPARPLPPTPSPPTSPPPSTSTSRPPIRLRPPPSRCPPPSCPLTATGPGGGAIPSACRQAPAPRGLPPPPPPGRGA